MATRVTAAICSVALPIPSPRPYRYAVPAALGDRVVRGARVVVPVRGRELVGIALDVSGPATDDGEELKSVLLAPDPTPVISESLLALASWMTAYYACPIGLTLRTMLPAALWGSSRLAARLLDPGQAAGGTSRMVAQALEARGGRATATALARQLRRPVWDVLQRLARVGAVALEIEAPDLGPRARTERIVTLITALPTLLERDREFGRARRQREAYESIDAAGGVMPVRLLSHLGFSASVVRGLVDRGVARVDTRVEVRDPFRDVTGTAPATPSTDQRRAIDATMATLPGAAATLFGVTGSGKTLVYLESLREAVQHGRGAIVLVPEIALTPQTVARVRGVFGDTVAVLHSGLSAGERVDAWWGLARGTKRVAVGARSAVFAPLSDLAAIVVDEEHDGSYKQGEQPRYHARDVALKRGRLEGARVVLGSATPSLETWARRDRIPVITLPSRVGEQPLPPVTLVDMRSEPRVADARAVPWSVTLDDAVQEALTAGDQVMLLLNRRGFAHFLQCRACGHVWTCPACSISLTVHAGPPGLRCHYCGHQQRVPDACPECDGAVHRSRGVGTQSVERWLGERFPTARLARMDADTTTGKWSHQRILDAVQRRDVDLLVGTQMIAKGLDFPGVTLVGVVDGDTALHLPDFRAAERTFQLVAQVAGRAGRGPRGGRVVVQTHTPTHYALHAAAAHDFPAFAARELELRRSPPYPPHVGLANVVVSGLEERRVADAALELGSWLEGLIQARAAGHAEVVGPAPAPLSRIKRRWRWHLLVRSADRRLLGRLLRYAARRGPRPTSVRAVIDRDPVSLL